MFGIYLQKFWGCNQNDSEGVGASESPYPSPSESPPTTKASEGPHPAARRPARMASAVVPVCNKRTWMVWLIQWDYTIQFYRD